MTKRLISGTLNEWKYAAEQTLNAAKSMPEDLWDFSPGAQYGSFAKQVRHVVCCRGVFADGFTSGAIDFSKKPQFYSGEMTKSALIEALQQSAESVSTTLALLADRDLEDYSTDYYGEKLSFIEHVSALTCHEAQHRGMWSFYESLGKKEI